MSEFVVMAAAIIGVSAVAFWRLLRGTTVFDRLLAASAVGTNAIALLVVSGFIFDRPDMFVDLALTYALLNFIGSVVAGKYLERLRRDEPAEREGT